MLLRPQAAHLAEVAPAASTWASRCACPPACSEVRTGTRWSGADFLRLVSRHGAIRDVAHPTGFTLVWLHPS